MVFQIVTNDKRVLTVHTEVGQGLAKVVVEESERKQDAESQDAKDGDTGKGGVKGE